MNTIKLTETVDATAGKNYPKTEVLKTTGSDFDNKTLSNGSQEDGISDEKLIAASEQVTLKKMTTSQEFNKWKLDSMIDYIINSHHRYAKENAVIIYNLAQKVAYHHGEKHPELIKLTTTMFLFLHDLLNCMIKEEEILYPSIKQLIKDKSHSGKNSYTTFGLIKDWVSLIHKEQQASIKDLKLLHVLTNDYMLPEDACNSYEYLFEKMKEFENDLLLHVHLENNILFPKAIDLDEELKEQERNVETW